MNERKKIDRYETVYESGRVNFYAVSGKNRILMPDAYKDMYDDHHLMIEKRTLERPELFDTEPVHWIPLFTGDSHA